MKDLTQVRLKELLYYYPDTGVFTYKYKGKGRRQNRIAGAPHREGYIAMTIDGKKYLAHRLAYLYMTGSFPNKDIDHINRVRKDNRWINLRDVTRTENMKNASLSKANTSGIVGVGWNRQINKWAAHIGIKNKKKHLGYFNCLTAAAITRKAAEIEYGFHKNHGT